MMKTLADRAKLSCDAYAVGSKEDNGRKPSLSTIIKTISKVTINYNWRYQKIMEHVKATCFSPHRTSSPDYKLGADNIAEHFQVFVNLHFFSDLY